MRRILVWAGCLLIGASAASAQKTQLIPHAQDAPPNEAYSPEEAAKRMTVPPGFTVEVVASEPMIVNPVAMTIDEKGRFWITESLEYPRRSPGKGRDRVKVLEDTDGDGKMDKATVFAEGLNIPSGIAVGGGGVWVANAPDLLFMQDTDGDLKADKVEVVLTGFGRDDTHELPNSLTWGPDGKLYGLNGVFNRSVVNYRGKTYDFTCALFRIDPRTRDFELFCEGTSNPWGVAFNTEGEAFISACVIDHLWHLTESGYYHRQGGPYPPNTWKIESIVDHNHQKAAYCGIHFFDSDAYPAEFREKLYMGNIHGNCINADALSRNGSTYRGKGLPDFLKANDAWFMPVVQKTGPDGCLYILDWYDRYHCYQDANRDPAGIDRLKGRLYRVRYKDTPRAKPFDLAKESDDQLIERLGSPNVYYRDIAQRLLAERGVPETLAKLESLATDRKANRKARLHALWARVGAPAVPPKFVADLFKDEDPAFRAWALRASGNHAKSIGDAGNRLLALAANDPSPDVRLQAVIAAPKIVGKSADAIYGTALDESAGDPLTPRIVWNNIKPSLRELPQVWREFLAAKPKGPRATLIPRAVELWSGSGNPAQLEAAAELTAALADNETKGLFLDCLRILHGRVVSGELAAGTYGTLKDKLGRTLTSAAAGTPTDETTQRAALLAIAIGIKDVKPLIEKLAADTKVADDRRIELLAALIVAGDPTLVKRLTDAVGDRSAGSAEYRARLVGLIVTFGSTETGEAFVAAYPKVEGSIQGRIIDALTQRAAWAKSLTAAVKAGKIPSGAVNLTQIRRLNGMRDKELETAVRSLWGTVRDGRNPQRDLTIDMMRRSFAQAKGADPAAGKLVFAKLCAQCHKMYGEGQEVGPDITLNGRSNYDQLLSNVFDPSLVIGEAYQAASVATVDGRVLTGLVVENSPQRVVLKLQGGKTETIARKDVEELKVSKLSLMPEDLEKQLQPQELVDLFSFLVLDKPPTDATAKPIPGTPRSLVK